MHRPCMFETVLVELEQALAAARRYDSLRYATIGCDHCARSDIPQRIFEEFYAGGANAGQASRTRDKTSEIAPRRTWERCREFVTLAHVPEKWTPVSEKDMRQRKNLERIPIPSEAGMRSKCPR